ncbi:hypothetical protein P7C70_g8200, partial [Phenoliferia sp. Uapishka_3]
PSIFLSRNSGNYALSGLRTSTRIEADEDASVRALAPSRRASDESIGSRSTWSAAVLGGFGRGTASLRTVGTGGTGDVLQERVGEESGETEAQRVVRKEGEGKGLQGEDGEEEDEERAREHATPSAGEARELSDSPPPILGNPLPSLTPSPSPSLTSPLSVSHESNPTEEEGVEELSATSAPMMESGTTLNGGGHSLRKESSESSGHESGVTTPRKEDRDARSLMSESDAGEFVDARSFATGDATASEGEGDK